MSEPTPKYYLQHETPAGTRYAYPLALTGVEVKKTYRDDSPWELVDTSVTVSQPAGTEMTIRGAWLVTTAPVDQVRTERPGARVREGMAKRSRPALDEDQPVSPELQAAFAAMPEVPTDEAQEHYAEHDAAHACWDCRVFAVTYAPSYVQGPPVVNLIDFDGWLPLPGDIDPDPDRKWAVADPSLLAVYGAHTAHLWPGVLSGLREPVIERLKQSPFVSSVQVWTHKPKAPVDITVTVPWETPRTRTEHVKPWGKRKSVPRTVPVWAMTVRIETDIPDGVRGATKAAAVDDFEAAVTRQVAKILPFGETPRACDHCGGTGRVSGDA